MKVHRFWESRIDSVPEFKEVMDGTGGTPRGCPPRRATCCCRTCCTRTRGSGSEDPAATGAGGRVRGSRPALLPAELTAANAPAGWQAVLCHPFFAPLDLQRLIRDGAAKHAARVHDAGQQEAAHPAAGAAEDAAVTTREDRLRQGSHKDALGLCSCWRWDALAHAASSDAELDCGFMGLDHGHGPRARARLDRGRARAATDTYSRCIGAEFNNRSPFLEPRSAAREPTLAPERRRRP
ncbi:hypothetical protein DFJ74DRAFT_647814 [Hyaloraphidium curvatum]|nr:hypothetical protein DFJ74DRAFT_647814 [Hyaloraphidium curvatum]